MARKIVDIIPVIMVQPNEGPLLTTQAQADLEAQAIISRLRAGLGKAFDFKATFATETQCEHCRSPWTEAGADYNGGCCDLDEANDPERLKDMAEVADAISAETFYRYEDGERGRVAINWPDQFGAAVSEWLEKGRPADRADNLMALAKRVASSDWCTVWSDPGPSDCSLARLPDSVTRDARPQVLAEDICSLLEDMDLLPATKAVA